MTKKIGKHECYPMLLLTLPTHLTMLPPGEQMMSRQLQEMSCNQLLNDYTWLLNL